MQVPVKIPLKKIAVFSYVLLLFACQNHDSVDKEAFPVYFEDLGLHFLQNNDSVLPSKVGKIALVDDGNLRNTHAFFSDKKVSRPEKGDYGSHVTALAGLILESSPKTSLLVFPNEKSVWNDLKTHADDVFISCHPYARIGGWQKGGAHWYWQGTPSISEEEDWKFGFYGKVPGPHIVDSVSIAGEIDHFLYNHPSHIAVFPAGNAKGIYPPEEASIFYWNEKKNDWDSTVRIQAEPNGGLLGYDCLSLQAVSKNAFVVTAVEAGKLGKKASRGPTDDGRIKPDFAIPCANISLVSAANDSTFVMQKEALTSYAAGIFSGACALLQAYFIHYMKEMPSAAALKTLLVHTAHSATGKPDYSFGWGIPRFDKALIFVQNMAKHSPEYVFISDTINPMDTFYMPLPLLNPEKKYRATLSWTDIPGPDLSPALNNRKPVLINDLDMEIFSANERYFPWYLQPDFPQKIAQKGINQVDNVERIDMQPSTGTPHFLQIVHKGGKGAKRQSFTIAFSALVTSSHLAEPE